MRCFEASREFHHTVLGHCHSEAADAIRSFFSTWNPAAAKSHPIIQSNWNELSEASSLIFQITGRDAQEDTELKKRGMIIRQLGLLLQNAANVWLREK